MNYTSIKQSKNLLELGLNPESADMHYLDDAIGIVPFTVAASVKHKYPNSSKEVIPCWSVGALLKVMATFTKPTAFSCKVSVPTIHHLTDEYEIIYDGDYKFPMIISDNIASVVSFKHGNLIDVCYEMVVWLLENNYIKNK